MKALITLVMTCLLSLGAFADDFAVAVGIRSTSADAVPTGATVSSKAGFGAGVIGIFDIAPKFQGRTGFLYNQRNTTIKSSVTSDEDLNLAYIDIPVTAMYRFADYAGAFAGPVLSLLASKDCKVTGGCAKDPESMSLGFQFGASFKFAPQMGAEVYYEAIPSEFWKDIEKNAKTVGFNLLFTFE